MNDLSTAQLRRLLVIQGQIEKLQGEKQRITGGQNSKPKPKLSAAARLKISKQMKKRWAERKAKGEKRL